jgi:hypothetical protein
MRIGALLGVACAGVVALTLAPPAVAAGGDDGADAVIGHSGFATGYPTECAVPPTASSLCQPMQSVVDGAGNVWVADYGNSRVLMFPPGSTKATRVLGTDGSFTTGEPPPSSYPGPGDSCNDQRGSAGADTLCQPEGLAIDRASGTLYVADTYNNRVLVYFNAASKTGRAPADLVLGQPNLASSDADNVAGGGTAPYVCPGSTNDRATQCTLNEPESVSLDATGDLLVADTFDNRVLEWPKTTLGHFGPGACASSCFIPATHVWGQYGSFETANPNNAEIPSAYASSCRAPGRASACTMFLPSDAVVSGGHLIVADYANNRLLDFPSALGHPSTQNAAAVYGQPTTSGNASNQGSLTPTAGTVWNPERIAADAAGDLWVADALNSRVLEFPPPGTAGATSARRVLGQRGSFTSGDLNGYGLDARALAVPAGVSIDAAGDVWVADSDNSRVLEFAGPFGAPPQAHARAAAPPRPPAPATTPSRPLAMLRPADLTALQSKVTANDPTWTRVKSDADGNVADTIYPYVHRDRTGEPPNTLFYDYQGSNWFDATMSLGLAALMRPSSPGYATQLASLADEMLAAQVRPQNVFPSGLPPLEVDDYYPTRYLGPTIGVMYSWIYNTLGAARRARMVKLMNAWFTDLAHNGYEVNDRADGNYMFGHALAAAFMGYASLGDNATAQEMIDFARIRFDGTPSRLLPSAYDPANHLDQVWGGGYTSAAAENASSNGGGTAGLLGAPFKAGFDFQGWAYGSGTFDRMIDYMVLVRAAGGPDFTQPGSASTDHWNWLDAILHGLKAAMLPNNFEVDTTGDWGGDVGGVVDPGVTLRLASVLAGKPDGPQAQHFNYSEIAKSPFPDVGSAAPAPWEDFFYGNPKRPSSLLATPLFYSGFNLPYPHGANLPPDHAVPYFLMRSDAGTSATWASFNAGSAYYDDHQHYDAGTVFVQHGNDPLLVDATDWKCDGPAFCTEGILGNSTELNQGAQANTLWFDDFGDAQCTDEQYFGGQGPYGKDQIVAAEQGAAHTYVRADLTTAYSSPYATGCNQTSAVSSELSDYNRSFMFVPGSSLFVILDQLKVRSSANRHGPYLKHLRWHFPKAPVVSGSSVHVLNGSSGLWMDAVAPSPPQLTAVNETSNPDGCDNGFSPCLPCDGKSDGLTTKCTPWGDDNAYTYRVEERYPGNPLAQRFVTVFQSGAKSSANPATLGVTSADGKLTGTRIVQPGGAITFVLFNAGAGQTPAPISQTSFTGAATTARYLLAGMAPGGRYSVTASGTTVLVTEASTGTVVATPAGVLDFNLSR